MDARLFISIWVLLLSPLVSAHLAEVLVEGKIYTKPGVSISASEGIINQQDIDSRPRLRTGDILELIPGMVITQHSGTGKSNQMFLRGFNLDHGTDFATFIDGMPINMRTHGHGQGYTDLNFIIPEVIDKINYKKGAYYADVSDFSGAGSAHMLTANQLDNGFTEFTAGEDDFYRFVVANSMRSDSADWIYALELNRYDGPWEDISEDMEKVNALLKRIIDWRGGHLAMTFMAYDNQWNSADQIPQRAVDSGLISELGSLDTSLGGESSRYSLNVNWHNNHIDANLYAIKSELTLWSNFTYFLDDPVNGDQFEQLDERWIYGGHSTYTHDHKDKPSTNPWHPIKTRVGLEWRYDDISDVGLFSSSNRRRTGVTRLDSVEEASAGLFFEASWQWTKRLSGRLGSRYDYFHFDVEDKAGINRFGNDLTPNSGTNDDGIVSIKANLAYQLTDSVETYLAAGQGFHSNDARGTTITIDPVDGASVNQVDPLVRSFGYEWGIRKNWKNKGNLALALWQLELDSELLFVGDAGNTEASDGSKRKGLELSVYYRFLENWLVDVEYSVSDAEFTDVASDSKEIPGAIDEVVQAGISVDDVNGWSGSLRLRYFGERPLIEDGSVESDSSTVTNLRIGYDIDNWSLNADILNLLDSDDHDIDYFYESQLGSELTGAEDIHFHIIEPRTIRFSARYQFD